MSAVTQERFRAIFFGRTDVWGAVHGECMRQMIREGQWSHHLHGTGSLGIYPLVTDDDKLVLRWGCVDIDEGVDLIVIARNLWKALKMLGISSWVERTKGKGYHVWVFATGWMPAEHMRRALLLACQVAGVLPKEVNPKQTSLEGLKGYGNYVNLPYAKQWADQNKRVVLRIDQADPYPYRLDEFVDMAWETRNDPARIAKAAKLYKPPPAPKPVDMPEYDGNLGELTGKLSGLAWTIFKDGPLEGTGRSDALARLCHLARECGLTPGETLAVVADADVRWGKFAGRTDGATQLQRLVTNAFSR